ncbi:hypothetical protein Patl1_11523 [Pistacia atlantica]|uniref:Uncharacterized protein n=1 Tax=Pistacia atlantica TaxID=434234 RepID=A0ACC1A706_9ROSI|nr:hypothetical protein Patl1_11523 [Pistacia atlantica]
MIYLFMNLTVLIDWRAWTVLKFLGADALKEVIENAELYQPQVPARAMQCA